MGISKFSISRTQTFLGSNLYLLCIKIMENILINQIIVILKKNNNSVHQKPNRNNKHQKKTTTTFRGKCIPVIPFVFKAHITNRLSVLARIVAWTLLKCLCTCSLAWALKKLRLISTEAIRKIHTTAIRPKVLQWMENLIYWMKGRWDGAPSSFN